MSRGKTMMIVAISDMFVIKGSLFLLETEDENHITKLWSFCKWARY